MSWRWHLSWVSVAMLAAGCRARDRGTLHARWAGLDTTLGTGAITLPMRAGWCPPRGRLMLFAVRGDSGVGILVRAVKLEPGLFGVADTVKRPSPGASVALRVTAGENLYALSADSGAVAITSVGAGLIAGRFVAWLSRPSEGPVLLVGDFTGVTTEPDSARCEANTVPPATPDSGVT